MHHGSRNLFTTSCLSAALLLGLPAAGYARPAGGQVSAGQASITPGLGSVSVTQSSNRAVIDWSGFNIGLGERVDFSQPSAGSIVLNRIHDASASQIDGQLNANGQVWLVNPNGIMFGSGAQVNIGGLVGTTSNISNSDFMSGNYRFIAPGNRAASVSNAGTITAANSGLVALVAPQVANSGVINAKLGKVALGSGDTFTLDLYGDGLIDLGVSDSVATQLVGNSGVIQADGGQVSLSAASAASAVNSVINMSGVIQARTLGDVMGSVDIYAEGSIAVAGNVAANKGQKSGASEVLVSGSVDASGRNIGETGGSITVTGDHVALLSGAKLDASGDAGGGYVKVGGDFHGAGTTPTAEATVVESGAVISADVLTSGKGGNVAVWADDYTNFAGSISAKGGSFAGNGGFVETSGKQVLDMSGLVDASASHGNAGTWLMDPADVTISTGADSGVTGNPSFVPNGSQAEAVLNVNDIDTALNAGTNVSVTTGGDALAGTNGGSITVASAISATTGTGGTTGSLTLSSYKNIAVNNGSAITLGGAGVTGGNLILDADNHNNGSGYIGIAAALSTNGGNITLGGGQANPASIVAGTGYATGNTGQVYGIYINNAAVNAGGGSIVANGRGYNTSTNSNVGIYINGASAALTTGNSGAIGISGIGQGTGNSNSDYGIEIATGSNVSTANGNLTINAQGGGAGSGTGNNGLFVTGAGSTVKTTGIGNLLITGTVGSAVGSGIAVTSAASIQAAGTGSITLNGMGGRGNGGTNYGVFLNNAGLIAANGGAMNVTGTGGNSSGNQNYGIYVNGSTISNTGAGAIALNGTGGGNTNSSSDSGVNVTNNGATAGIVSTADGALTVIATGGGGGTGGSSYGLSVAGTGSTVETTGAGSITITGTGGSGSGAQHIGIYVQNLDNVQALGSGNIAMTGTGGGTGVNTVGVNINGSVVAHGGDITITGTGGNGSSKNYGVSLNGTQGAGNGMVSTTGSGNITITGTGGGTDSAGGDYGVYVWSGGGTNSGGATTFNGNISVTGYGGDNGGTGRGNYGVYIANAATGSIIQATGSGNVIVNGTGGNSTGGGNYGIDLAQPGSLQATGGGSVIAVAHGSDFFLDTSGSVLNNAFGTAITLATAGGGDFINNNGVNALSDPNGRWLIYSTSPLTDQFGGLTARFTLFGCSYGSYCPGMPGSGNGFLFSALLPDSVTIANAIGFSRASDEWEDRSREAAPASPPAVYCEQQYGGAEICHPLE